MLIQWRTKINCLRWWIGADEEWRLAGLLIGGRRIEIHCLEHCCCRSKKKRIWVTTLLLGALLLRVGEEEENTGRPCCGSNEEEEGGDPLRMKNKKNMLNKEEYVEQRTYPFEVVTFEELILFFFFPDKQVT